MNLYSDGDVMLVAPTRPSDFNLRIFLEEQEGKDRADYRKFLIKTLSGDRVMECGGSVGGADAQAFSL
ncbi:hypothetical protein [Pedobacter heparinus]|uniref:hypothetical protein n=1 Tax=Pedobacter heparinus TaxID=984 RepID=UPI00292FA342|nr:hypothetical protein [Pedobacter heparinus]